MKPRILLLVPGSEIHYFSPFIDRAISSYSFVKYNGKFGDENIRLGLEEQKGEFDFFKSTRSF